MGFPSISVAAFLLMVLPVFGLDILRRRTLTRRVVAGLGLAGAASCFVAALAGTDHVLPAAPVDLVAATGDQIAWGAAAYWSYGLILAGIFWIVVYAAAQRGAIGAAPATACIAAHL
jgi:hypothetical protein